MLVYHGGSVPIREIDLQKCRPYTDFGRGFYATKFRVHAENWAKRAGKHRNNGFVTTFNYIEKDLTIFIEQASEHILNSLIKEKGIDVNTASDLFYSSKTFYNIADSGTGFCKLNWHDIYKMLLDELKYNYLKY
jgi:hypothetical protein